MSAELGVSTGVLVAAPADKHALRRRLVQALFGRMFSRLDRIRVTDGTLPLTGIHRIVVCRPNHRLGNIVLLTPLIAELERVYPGAEIHLLLGVENGAEIFSGYRGVGRVHCVTARMARHPILLAITLRRLRRLHPDLAIDASPGSQSGCIFTALMHARHVVAARAASAESPGVERQHFAQRSVSVFWRALPPPVSQGVSCPPLSIRLSADEIIDAEQTMRRLTHCRHLPSHVFVGIFTNATGAKKLTREWWGCFLAHLLLLRPEVRVIEFLPAFGRSLFGCRFTTFYSTDVRRMAALMSRLSCFVSTDCGVMHLACASGVHTYGLFTTTDPATYGPYGNGSRSFRVSETAAEVVAETVVQDIGNGRAAKS